MAHGIAFIGDNVIFTDRKCNQLKQLIPTGEVMVTSGDGQFKTASGRPSSSSHEQPMGVATEGHAICVCDSGSQTIRIITPTPSLATYLENIRKTFQVFSVHLDKTKCGYQQHEQC